MLDQTTATPWHKESFDRFLDSFLPDLLAQRLPGRLVAYHAARANNSCAVSVGVRAAEGRELSRVYADLPYPEANGLFVIERLGDTPEGARRLILPLASEENLETATVRCVGEQVRDWVAARLGQAPADLPWDDALLDAWLPLDAWLHDFFVRYGQMLDPSNDLASQTHLRRVFVEGPITGFAAGQIGRACPVETAEGPNVGRVLVLARGATIRDNKVVIVGNSSPTMRLGLGASLIPFLEHTDAFRLLMGANMMRQWHTPPTIEPPLVASFPPILPPSPPSLGGVKPVERDPGAGQIAQEREASSSPPDFGGLGGRIGRAEGLESLGQNGRNLLTAFISWGADTHDDALVISQSCATRLAYPKPIEPGDKMSNRHGIKGVVSRILPDNEMPHLSDGTPIEIVFSFTGLISRLAHGQLLEAAWSRVARVEGTPLVAPPFAAPSLDELRAHLEKNGLPASGQEVLTTGKNGPPLERPSTVGWVYWGRLHHDASDKLHVAGANDFHGQRVGPSEYAALRAKKALRVADALFNHQSVERTGADAPAPRVVDLAARLRAGGVALNLDNKGGLTFAFTDDLGESLSLSRPLPHPWLRERLLARVGALPDLPAFAALRKANERHARLAAGVVALQKANERRAWSVAGDAPAGLSDASPVSLSAQADADLEAAVWAYFDELLAPQHLLPGNRVRLSGRAVVAPGGDLALDQIGLPSAMITSFLGDQASSDDLARAWVLAFRTPTPYTRTSLLAFHPTRLPLGERVVRVHPLVCPLLDCDFDGDQIAIFFPRDARAQREAGDTLSVAAQFERDPSLVQAAGLHASLWGLASLSLLPIGQKAITNAAGIDVAFGPGYFDKATLVQTLNARRERDGVGAMLAALDALTRLGFEAAKHSGASLGPFVGQTLELPQKPEGEAGPNAWDTFAAELGERIIERAHDSATFNDADLGPLLLALASGARGSLGQAMLLVGGGQAQIDATGKRVGRRHGFRDGLDNDEVLANAFAARTALKRIHAEYEAASSNGGPPSPAQPFRQGVLARALRSPRPGVVFARAAQTGETDPLSDEDAGWFVGLPLD